MNIGNPLVSVIVPNYNHARYLSERLDSIRQQTYQNYEIIILDDASTDNSKEVIERYREVPHVSKIVYNEVNSGSTFKQWHKGFELANGELIWIAESDDKCEPVLLEKLVAEFNRNKNLVLAFCLDCFFYNTGESFNFIPKDHTPITRLSGKDFIKRYMLDGSYVGNASSAVFKKEVAQSVDKSYMSFKNAGDHLFWIEIAEEGNVAIINEHLNFCRRHGANITEKNYMTGLVQREDRRVMDYIRENHLASRLQCRMASARYAFGNICQKEFDSDTVRNDLLDIWNIGVFEKFCIKLLEVRALLSKVKRKLM